MSKSMLIAAVIYCGASIASAVELQLVVTGIGSGTIGETTFTDELFTITSLGDTANRLPFPGVAGYYFIDHDSSSISIDNVGSFQILSGTRTYVYNKDSIVGFARYGEVGADLYVSSATAAFATWDMLTPIGPISTTGKIFEFANTRKYNTPINTDGGVLIINDADSSPETFTAIVVPEPSTVVLLALSGLSLIFGRQIAHPNV